MTRAQFRQRRHGLMPPELDDLTPGLILVAARNLLDANGFQVESEPSLIMSDLHVGLLAEDRYSIIALAIYDTWAELKQEWPDAQASLVTLIGQRLARSAPKAWDGYLVLVCLSSAVDQSDIEEIEKDTTRLRKIVATGSTLRTIKDVERLLDRFLP